eukprot:TRINITY_DN13476_c0_g1_i2.p1 TRINITY_DN13476_c0_g1~~TRINITY_DN13476_c0_g1_i2.p1  ORF type:complete len:142 (+),score=42.39 TRINITY_DN13476_c0_g1_i2:122-547(+)
MPERDLLPTTVTPRHYGLDLTPDLAKYTFAGVESIDVTVHQATKTVTMHCKEIVIASASITPEGGAEVTASDISYTTAEETTTLTFPADLAPGNATIKLTFTGELNDKMAGFYRSSYKAPNGEERIMATTQFEACDARYVS